MGDKYEGRIRKVDLQTDTPWNTYTRAGLPPTPIANPGLAALKRRVNLKRMSIIILYHVVMVAVSLPKIYSNIIAMSDVLF